MSIKCASHAISRETLIDGRRPRLVSIDACISIDDPLVAILRLPDGQATVTTAAPALSSAPDDWVNARATTGARLRSFVAERAITASKRHDL